MYMQVGRQIDGYRIDDLKCVREEKKREREQMITVNLGEEVMDFIAFSFNFIVL